MNTYAIHYVISREFCLFHKPSGQQINSFVEEERPFASDYEIIFSRNDETVALDARDKVHELFEETLHQSINTPILCDVHGEFSFARNEDIIEEDEDVCIRARYIMNVRIYPVPASPISPVAKISEDTRFIHDALF